MLLILTIIYLKPQKTTTNNPPNAELYSISFVFNDAMPVIKPTDDAFLDSLFRFRRKNVHTLSGKFQSDLTKFV